MKNQNQKLPTSSSSTIVQQNTTRSSSSLLSLLSTSAAALESDASQPIYVEADSVEINDGTGVSVYQGNVDVTQGSIHLTADVNNDGYHDVIIGGYEGTDNVVWYEYPDWKRHIIGTGSLEAGGVVFDFESRDDVFFGVTYLWKP